MCRIFRKKERKRIRKLHSIALTHAIQIVMNEHVHCHVCKSTVNKFLGRECCCSFTTIYEWAYACVCGYLNVQEWTLSLDSHLWVESMYVCNSLFLLELNEMYICTVNAFAHTCTRHTIYTEHTRRSQCIQAQEIFTYVAEGTCVLCFVPFSMNGIIQKAINLSVIHMHYSIYDIQSNQNYN